MSCVLCVFPLLNRYLTPSLLIFQAYQKGASPKYHVLPAGGKVLTSEEDYNLLSDKHFPDPVGKPSLKLNCQTPGSLPYVDLFWAGFQASL